MHARPVECETVKCETSRHLGVDPVRFVLILKLAEVQQAFHEERQVRQREAGFCGKTVSFLCMRQVRQRRRGTSEAE